MRYLTAAATAASLFLMVASSYATTCTVGGFTYTCEYNCTGTTLCQAPASGCDLNSDGICVVCGDSANNFIRGTNGNDVICGFDGDDRIIGRPATSATGGNDIIDGGNGNDTLTGGTGHDEIYGDDGDDVLFGGGGNDTLVGGNGNDTLQSANSFFGGSSTYSVNLCGGPGEDVLIGLGYGHQCMDGGDDLGIFGDECEYAAPTSGATLKDVGTARHCEYIPPESSPLLSIQPPCGCQ